MIRILFFLAIVVAFGSALAFIAAQSGEVVLIAAGHRIVLPLFTAVCAMLIIFAVFLLLWWLVKTLIRMPRTVRDHLGGRRERQGFQALSQGLIATMSGDIRAAQRLTKQSHALLRADREPLLPLLAAETKRLELDYQGAVAIFQSMCDNPQTRLIGLKGLYREAMRDGDDALAGHYARQALELDPALEWPIRASVTQYALEQSWDEALRLLDDHDRALRKTRRKIKKSDIAHWRVVLLCAKAEDDLATRPDLAREQALRAHKLAPDFVPAAAIAAKSLFLLGERKKATRFIENFWSKNPHPDLGQIYLKAQSGAGEEAGADEKLRRALRLERLKPQDPVSQLLVAQAALAAGDVDKARHYGEKLLDGSPSESVFLLLADIEAAFDGDESKIRTYLTQAVQAPADFAWVADGQIMPQWVAISPLSHRIGACEWRQPPKHLPPLLALQNGSDEAHSSSPQIQKASIAATQDHVAQDEATNQESQPQSEGKADPEMQASTVILPPSAPPRKERPPSQWGNSTNLSPTRIVVDDPGIAEGEDSP